MDSELWNAAGRAGDIYNLALFGLLAGLILTFVSAIALVWAFSHKNRSAEEALATALATQEKTKLEAARANERADQLLLRARQAEMEQARNQSKQPAQKETARHITAETRDMIIKSIRGQSFAVSLLYDNGDAEAAHFSEELEKTLTDAGLKVTRKSSLFQIQSPGIGLSLSRINGVGFLYAALRNAGFSTVDLPEKDPPMIVVGKNPQAGGTR